MTRAWTDYTEAELRARQGAKWDHVSVSQIETADLCLRKWYFNKIMKLPTPENAAAQLGKQTHVEIEAYSKGTLQPAQLGNLSKRIYAAGLIPKPKTSLVEWSIPNVVIAGVPLEGYVDDFQAFKDVDKNPLITDWKTRGSLAWIKDEERLRTDTQALIYSWAAMAHTGRKKAEFRHVNICTRPPHDIVVSGPVVFESNPTWLAIQDRILPLVERMKETSKLKSPFDVTATPSACSAFGGCPFRDKCNAADKVAAISVNNEPERKKMPTKAEVAARIANAGKKAEPAKTPEVRPPDAPASGGRAALEARLKARQGADVTKAPEAPAKAPEAPAGGGSASGTDRKPRGFAVALSKLGFNEDQIARMLPSEMHRAINEAIDGRAVSVTPDGKIVIPTKAPAPSGGKPGAIPNPPDTEDVAYLDKCAKYAAEYLGWDGADGGEIDSLTDELLAFVCEKQIRRDTVDLTYGEDGKIEDIEEKAASEAPERPSTIAPPADGLILYIDCRPVKGVSATALDDLIAVLGAAVAKDAKMEHYMLLEYSDGAKRIAALMLRNPPKGAFVVNSKSFAAPYVLEVLRPLADAIVTAGA